MGVNTQRLNNPHVSTLKVSLLPLSVCSRLGFEQSDVEGCVGSINEHIRYLKAASRVQQRTDSSALYHCCGLWGQRYDLVWHVCLLFRPIIDALSQLLEQQKCNFPDKA